VAEPLTPAVVRRKDADDLARGAADAVAALIIAAAQKQARFTLALSGGSTPQKLYQCLARDWRDKIPWERVHFFWGDERFVPPDHPDSNYRMVRESLLQKIPVPSANIHPVPAQCETAREAAAEYERELRFFFGPGDFPAFDVSLMGLGEDGHTASLFPGSPALNEKSRWAVDAKPGMDPRHDRVTLTVPVFSRARRTLFLVAGAGKARVLKQVLQGPLNRHPAQLIQPAPGTLEWWVDADALPS